MELLKYTLMSLIVTCLSVAADPLKQKPQTLNSSPAKNYQQVANELKPDFVPIHLFSREDSLDGDYNFKYETGNGIFVEESGVMLNKGTENEANSVVGSYKYVSPEGVPIEVTYTSGVDGFRAYGAHLPVGPPAPPNVPKSLAFKNVAPMTAFARPQFRAVNSDGDGQTRPAEQQLQTDSEKRPAEQVPVSREPASEQANDVAEQSRNVVYVGQGPTEKPLETVVRTTVLASDQSAQQLRNQLVPEPQSAPLLRFEPPRSAAPSVVPVLQTVPQAVQTQPKVVPVLQRLIPGGYTQQQRQVQQPPFNQQQPPFNQQQPPFNQQLPPFNQQLPPFNQQQRPGPVRQFSVEPQYMMRYVPNNQQGRYFQLPPPMQRSLGPPKY